jgi:hypothetical protein
MYGCRALQALFRQSRQTYGDAEVAASKRDSADVWPFDLNRL